MTIDNVLYPSFYDLSDKDKYDHTLEAVEALQNQLSVSLERLKALSESAAENMMLDTLHEITEKELRDIHSVWYNNIKVSIKNEYPKCVNPARTMYQ